MIRPNGTGNSECDVVHTVVKMCLYASIATAAAPVRCSDVAGCCLCTRVYM